MSESDFLLFFLTPDTLAIGAILAVLVVSCYLIYDGIRGMIKKESMGKSIGEFLGGLVICGLFIGGLVYFIKKKIKD
jgi:hypothetical protein